MPHDDEDDHEDRRMSRRLVEFFGADLDGGEWGRTMRIVERHDTELSDLRALRWQLMGMVTLAGVITGALVSILPKIL